MPDESQEKSHVTRAVAVGNRIRLAKRMTEADYVAELERIVALAAPHLCADRPNLLVLTELLGLPAALVGRRGALARRARTSRTALTLLALALLPRVLTYRRRWRVTLPQALLLASTDALYRPFAETLSRLARQYSAHIVATTLAPHVRRSVSPREIARWGRRGADAVYLPEGPEVYNAALVFGPDGALLGRVDKVYLTKSEIAVLNLTPGRLEDVRVIATAAGRLGVAISLDAFTPEYLRHLDGLGAEIVAQPDANDQQWAAPSATCDWQPAEWLNSVLGSIQPEYPHLRYNICAMQTGNFFDLTFDGQSTIKAKPAATSGPAPHARGVPFVGVDEWVHTVTGEPLVGEFLAASPWVADDPVVADPSLSLDERWRRLRALADELLPGGKRANQYRESVVWADLPLE
ncbi:MAG TPA: nitrilase-related carbon-nitrogen hydrolase [Ktedonobacterales bacterium]|nr:nitrilase-related carbon-nitrogen hydrolase [Ktedonobacterales bacterium]